MEVTELIGRWDIVLFILYCLLAWCAYRYVFFRRLDKKTARLFNVFFMCKTGCALFMTLMMVYYWGMSDNTAFFQESLNFYSLLKSDVSNFKFFFLPVEQYNERIQLDPVLSATASSIGVESNFFAVKVSTLLMPLALSKYLLVNLLFSLVSISGQFIFYRALVKRYPLMKKSTAIAVLLMPSVLLYSSYYNKETLCMACIGFAFYALFELAARKKIILNFLIVLINVFFIGIMKVYILFSFAMALLIFVLVKLMVSMWRSNWFMKGFLVVLLGITVWRAAVNINYFNPYILKFIEQSNTFQVNYKSLETSGAAFEFGEIETSLSGLLRKMPLGFYTTYFRPNLWEVNKPILFFTALESLFVLLLVIWALLIRRRYFLTVLRTDFFACISLYYCIVFGVIVGLTTFNFGSLVRYKIPGVPFLMMLVFLLISYRPVTRKAGTALS